jgi:uncharacterized protein YcbK (DUF882 family)
MSLRPPDPSPGICGANPVGGRRRVITLACAAAAAGLASAPRARAEGRARASPALAHARTLWVTRPQTQESVRAVYWADERIQWDGYRALNHLYRDVHVGLQYPIALRLLDLNFLMQSAVHRQQRPRPMVLLSGFRTRLTNEWLGGATPDIHGAGQADDFVYEGLSLQENFRLAKAFQVGGVGLYPDRHSLHKDVGRRRSWVTYGRG